MQDGDDHERADPKENSRIHPPERHDAERDRAEAAHLAAMRFRLCAGEEDAGAGYPRQLVRPAGRRRQRRPLPEALLTPPPARGAQTKNDRKRTRPAQLSLRGALFYPACAGRVCRFSGKIYFNLAFYCSSPYYISNIMFEGYLLSCTHLLTPG